MPRDIEIPAGKNCQMDRRIARNGYVSKSASITVLLLAAGILLCSCAPSAGTNAKRACQIVQSSIAIYNAAGNSSSVQSQLDKQRALVLLRSALPFAAIAAGSNGEYQALQATLSESNRVSEHHLVRALSRECAQILPSKSTSQAPGGFVPPSNIKATGSR